MFELFVKEMQGMIDPGDRVAVALSGGADSVCLLYLCRKFSQELPFSLSAAHVNHGLREEADKETAFCRQLCEQWEIPLYETKVDTHLYAKEQGVSVELGARILRYQFFETLEQDHIALAHHQDDQAETVLLHLIRGAGLEGCSGMAPLQGKFIRPLLHVSRKEIEAFCRENELNYCTDQSNFSREYTRNKLRLDVMPQLSKIQPEVSSALARAGELFREDELQLQQDTKQAFERIFHSFEGGFDCDRTDFFALSRSLQRRTIRMCWEKLTGGTQDLWFHQTEAAIGLFEQGKTGKKYCLGQDIWAENSYDRLLVAKQQVVTPFCIPLKEGSFVDLPQLNIRFLVKKGEMESEGENTWIFDYNRVKTGINIRSRKEGDRFCLNGQTQKLKKIFIDRKIPRTIRNQAVILECNGEIIAVTGLGVARDYRGVAGQECLIVKQERRKNK